jgi:hypothetical protein
MVNEWKEKASGGWISLKEQEPARTGMQQL